MPCFKAQDENKLRSKEIEKQLKQWHLKEKNIIKILLLGSGESGKTTIIKQMKILHIKGFSHSERIEKIKDIHQNIHESIYDLVINHDLISPPITIKKDQTIKSINYIKSLGGQTPALIDQDYFYNVRNLWKDKGIQECYERSNEFQLIESAKYFLDKINEIADPNFLPSDDDILHCRKTTTTIQKIEFQMKVPIKYGGGFQEFWMFDVGGQRGERKKWIQVFDGIDTVLFLVASSDFDLTLREVRNVNRLQEAVNLFESVWTSRYLVESGFIVFLNKQDILQDKVERGKNIGKYFPNYNTYEINDKNNIDEYNKTKLFIRDMFQQIVKKKKQQNDKLYLSPGFAIPVKEINRERKCYFHFTNATDTKNIKTVFDDVHSMVIEWALSDFGLH